MPKNYYLDDIADFLTNEGFSGVVVGQYQSNMDDQIALLPAGGNGAAESVDGKFDFQILVTSSQTDKGKAARQSEAIWRKLANKKGTLTTTGDPVRFLSVTVTSYPTLLNVNANGLPEITTLFEAHLVDSEVNTMYN